MARQDQDFCPYAAPANMIALLNRVRTRNLPETVNNAFLRIAGIPEAMAYRVVQALRFLNLIHEDGRPTDMFKALAASTDTQYRELLEKVVREAYRNMFDVIDPGQDPQARIIDAFRRYQPRSQTTRMVMLFLGLCREAGIPVLDMPRERRMKEPKLGRPKPLAQKPSVGVQTKKQPMETSEPITAARGTSALLFGVTEDDIAVLSEGEFNEVWAALGKVARARARAKRQTAEEVTAMQKTKEEDQEHDEE